MMSRFISRLAASIEPYVPGEQPKDKKYIKLNTNENPYPPSKAVIESIKQSVSENLRLYPDPVATAARQAVAEYYNKTLKLEGQNQLTFDNVFMGNGSDEILSLMMPAFFNGRTIAFPDITYSFYPVIANLFQVKFIKVPLTEKFEINIDNYINGNPSGADGILICNPNAPSGRALALADIEKIIKNNSDRLVVIDEAYVDFGAQTAAGIVNSYDNVLVVQTLSKSRQLAGLRIGFAIACTELIDILMRAKDSFNSYPVDRLAETACIAAFKDVEYFEQTRTHIIATREHVVKRLKILGFDVIPSAANFIFVKPPSIAAAEKVGKSAAAYMFEKLREEGILVRYFALPRISNMLRITIGTDTEMSALLSVTAKLIKGSI